VTLLDLCRLLKRYLWLVIALPLVCALGCFVFFGATGGSNAKYTAASRIVVSTHVQDVAGLAAGEVRAVMADAGKNGGIEAKSAVDGNTKTVTITVTGTDEDAVLKIANESAVKVCEEAIAFVPDNIDDPFNARVEKASEATAAKADSGMFKYIIVALLAGLFVAICIVVIIDMVKRPVKSVEGVQDAVELPVLEILPMKDKGERLLANVRFASKKDELKSVCVIPVGEGDSDEATVAALVAAAKAEGLDARADAEPVAEADLTVIHCESLSQGMKAAYVARKADAAILVARQWADSLKALESAVAELKLADTNLVGVVFAKQK